MTRYLFIRDTQMNIQEGGISLNENEETNKNEGLIPDNPQIDQNEQEIDASNAQIEEQIDTNNHKMNQQHPQPLNQSQQDPQEQMDQQKIEKTISPDLINLYENRIYMLEQRLSTFKTTTTQLKQRNLNYQSQLSEELQSKIQLSYKIKQYQIQNQSLISERDALKSELSQFEQRLKSFETEDSIEDVKKQLQISRAMEEMSKKEIQNFMMKIELLEKNQINCLPDISSFKMLQEEKNKVEECSMNAIVLETKLQKELAYQQLLKQENLRLQQQVRSQNVQLASLNQKINNMQNIISQIRLDYQKLQQSHSKTQNQLSKLQTSSQDPHSNYLIQKQQILKDYLELQRKFYTMKETFQQTIKSKSQIESKLTKALSSTIPKQQYDSLSRRYVQAKKKLEQLFGNNFQTNVIMVSQDQPIIELKNKLSQQESKQAQLLKKLDAGLLTSNYTQVQLVHQKQELQRANNEASQFKYSSECYKKELQLTQQKLNKAMGRCIQLSKKLNQQNDRWSKTDMMNKQLLLQSQMSKIKNDTTESKMISLGDTVIKLETISKNYKLAYDNIKRQLEQATVQLGVKRNVVEGSDRRNQPQLQFKIVDIPRQTVQLSQSTQTINPENVSKLKQLTQLLQSFPDKLNHVLSELQTTNKRGCDLNLKYNSKFKNLTLEKQQNQAWRTKTREQVILNVRKQFIQIRELIEDQRLLNALQKAKYLIDQYSKQYEQAQPQAAVEVPKNQVQPQREQLQKDNIRVPQNQNQEDPTLTL